jgi:hypothetical protein
MINAAVTCYAGVISLGSAITFGLLLLMQHLIATGENPFVDSPGARYRFIF